MKERVRRRHGIFVVAAPMMTKVRSHPSSSSSFVSTSQKLSPSSHLPCKQTNKKSFFFWEIPLVLGMCVIHVHTVLYITCTQRASNCRRVRSYYAKKKKYHELNNACTVERGSLWLIHLSIWSTTCVVQWNADKWITLGSGIPIHK